MHVLQRQIGHNVCELSLRNHETNKKYHRDLIISYICSEKKWLHEF